MQCKKVQQELVHMISDKEFQVGKFKFIDIRGVSKDKIPTDYEEKIPIAKPAGMIKRYVDLFYDKDIKNMLEFGIYYGGSAIIWNIIFPSLRKLVSIDLCHEREGLRAFLEKNFPNKISLHFNTSQDDKIKLKEIIEYEFDGPIDLIIDDASHMFELSLKSFEIAFPYLRPYGYYVIEDWGWAHWKHFANYEPNKKGLPALSNLIFLLCMAHASSPSIIHKITIISPSLVIIQKGAEEISKKSEFSLFKIININNKKSMIYFNENFFESWTKMNS